ncbi:MAG: FCD domain-containing protein, partial [Pseudomonadota bacterium]
HTEALNDSLDQQKAALASEDTATFHDLDYGFHRVICEAAGLPLAFDTIRTCKRHVDRLCLLSLTHDEERDVVLADHLDIAAALAAHDALRARALVRSHVGRLDPVIADIHATHQDYFQ